MIIKTSSKWTNSAIKACATDEIVSVGMGSNPPIPLYIIKDTNTANVLIARPVDNVRSSDQRVAFVDDILQLTTKFITLDITLNHIAVGPRRKTADHWIIEASESSELP